MKQVTNQQTNARTMIKFRFLYLLQVISATFLLVNIARYAHNNETKDIIIYVAFGAALLLHPFLIYAAIQQYKNSVAHKSGNSSVDPIAEANVYLAYGRKEQAATILEEALTTDPDNEKILEKLKSIKK